MRREDAIKNELKKLHTVYIAPYQYDLRFEALAIYHARTKKLVAF